VPFECAASRASGIWHAQIEYRFVASGCTDPVAERLPFQQFHGYEDRPSARNLVDREMFGGQERDAALAYRWKTAEGLHVVGTSVGKELRTHRGDPRLKVSASPYTTPMPPPTDLAEDAVMRNSCPTGLGGVGHC